MIQNFITFIHRRYDWSIQILKTDRETALGKQFTEWTIEKGIIVEYLSSYLLEQNGAAE